MPETEEIAWKIESGGSLTLSRNVGGIFKLTNNKDSNEIQLVTDDPAVDNPVNHIRPDHTIVVKIAPERDLAIMVVPPATSASGTYQLVTSLTK